MSDAIAEVSYRRQTAAIARLSPGKGVLVYPGVVVLVVKEEVFDHDIVVLTVTRGLF